MTNKLIFTFALIALFFSFSNLNAQKLGLRVEYGLNSIPQQSQYLLAPGKKIDYVISTKSVTASQSIGLYTSMDFGFIFFQPEVLYTTYSTTLTVESYGEGQRLVGSDGLITENFQQIDIPVYAGVKFNNIKIGAGPVFHVGENINTEVAEFDKITVKPTAIAAGMQIGLGLDLKYVNLDIKYQRDFNQSTDHIQYDNRNTGLRSSLSSLKIGLAFSISK